MRTKLSINPTFSNDVRSRGHSDNRQLMLHWARSKTISKYPLVLYQNTQLSPHKNEKLWASVDLKSNLDHSEMLLQPRMLLDSSCSRCYLLCWEARPSLWLGSAPWVPKSFFSALIRVWTYCWPPGKRVNVNIIWKYPSKIKCTYHGQGFCRQIPVKQKYRTQPFSTPIWLGYIRHGQFQMLACQPF